MSLDITTTVFLNFFIFVGDHIDPNKEFLYPGLVGEAPKPPLKHVHLTQVGGGGAGR